MGTKMRKIGELNPEELLMYSLALVAITEMMLDDDENLRNNIIYAKEDFNFKVQITKDYILVITYDKERHQLYYGDVLIPNRLFDII